MLPYFPHYIANNTDLKYIEIFSFKHSNIDNKYCDYLFLNIIFRLSKISTKK